jgi:RHS repeat-associated protein
LQQTVNGATTTYTLDLAAGLTQVLGDGTNTYLYGSERIAQNSTAAGKQYFLNDALGSVRRLTNAGGTPTLTRSYEPYGKVLTSTGAGSTAYGFAGEWTDNTGLIHLRARYYASGVGRFVSKDMWPRDYRRPLSHNGWLYSLSNPVNYTDPSGLCAGNGDEACWAVYEEIIRRRPDLVNATLITMQGNIPLHQVSYNRLKFILENELGALCVATPKVAGAENYAYHSSCYAIDWVNQHRNEIAAVAQRHGVPPELVAGILASEIDFDYDFRDVVGDTAFQGGGDWVIDNYLMRNRNPGPGVGSIHYETGWLYAQRHYLLCGYELGEIFTTQGTPRATFIAPGMGPRTFTATRLLTAREWVKVVLTDSGAIEGVSIIARFLADYRTGTGGKPNKTSHYTDLTPTDMAQIFGAYRNGVGGLTCFNDPDGDGDHACGFTRVFDFQRKATLGDQARQAYPYFTYFADFFR